MTLILLTRPEPDSLDLQKFLEINGFETVLAPMLILKEAEMIWPDVSKYAAIVVTSKNAVRILAENTFGRDIPVFTVGAQTALLAKELGFEKVRAGGGDVAGLIDLLKSEAFDKPLLYLRGKNITLDLVDTLQNHNIDEKTIYEMIENPYLPDAALQIIQEEKLDVVLLYSKRTAESFFSAIEQSRERDTIKMGLRRTTILCLGNSVLEYASNKHEGIVRLIKDPSEETVLTLLKEIKS